MSKLKLYSYFRSSAAYRVRIALNLKAVPHDIVPVHLLRDGGEHLRAEYRALNPQGRVPALVVGTDVLVQSPAILEWIEETYPEPSILPGNALQRAHVRAMAAIICCDITPLQNLGVQKWLKSEFSATPSQMSAWLAHWMGEGFAAVEHMIEKTAHAGPFCCGSTPSIADICLVPQVFAARRFAVPLESYPRILAAVAACDELKAFQKAAPQAQIDAE